jgi:hypothetical protein
MADLTYTVILNNVGIRAFTIPPGYWPDVEIHCWGAGGGTGWGGAPGGGGGYAKTTINVSEGDEISLQIGQPGKSAPSAGTGGEGGIDPTYRRFRGGNGGTRGGWCGNVNGPFPSGGGGGASWVALNGTFVCVAAGGGGGGGYGHKGYKVAGLPGGVWDSLSALSNGGDASYGGGGGGGFPKGGAAGYATGHAVWRGSGGQNYGDVTAPGILEKGAGKDVSYYPKKNIGNAGFSGYVLIVLRKKIRAFIKNANGSGDWDNITAMYTKVPGETVSVGGSSYSIVSSGWKQIQAAWTKIDGQWEPILTNKPIDLYNYPTKRLKANIIISSDTNDYNLYSNIPTTYFEGLLDVDVWVLPNVVVTGNTTSTAFTISGFDSRDTVRLHNYGVIQGRGGNGGSGSYTYTAAVVSGSKSSGGTIIGYTYNNGKGYSTTRTAAATAGSSGGTGLLLTSQITLLNNGVIAGGGGGGGGGTSSGRGGGGGGYGTGYNNGTLTAGGAGGTGAGAGGARGAAGSAGSAAGGAAGYAIQGNILIIPGTSISGTTIGPIAG